MNLGLHLLEAEEKTTRISRLEIVAESLRQIPDDIAIHFELASIGIEHFLISSFILFSLFLLFDCMFPLLDTHPSINDRRSFIPQANVGCDIASYRQSWPE